MCHVLLPQKERLEAVMREQGNEAAVAHKQQLEVDLLRAQQGLLEMEAAGLEKDKLVAELERRWVGAGGVSRGGEQPSQF